jgi:hypothetical protein
VLLRFLIGWMRSSLMFGGVHFWAGFCRYRIPVICRSVCEVLLRCLTLCTYLIWFVGMSVHLLHLLEARLELRRYLILQETGKIHAHTSLRSTTFV